MNQILIERARSIRLQADMSDGFCRGVESWELSGKHITINSY